MKIAKRFRWEGAHRLPWHEGLCKNLHGHSYTMFVEIEGKPDENGLLMDFKHLKDCLKDLVDAWDHATVVDEKMGSGEQMLQYNLSGLPAGIYFYRLNATGKGEEQAVGKIVKF